MAAAILALLPPVLVILAVQRWFVQGLVGMEQGQRSGTSATT
jgi:ABC-type glycerol-3-phosphate transport system permease component